MNETAPTGSQPFRRAITAVGGGSAVGSTVWFRSNLSDARLPTGVVAYLVVHATERTIVDGFVSVGNRNLKPGCSWTIRWTFAEIERVQCYPFQFSVLEPGQYNLSLPFDAADALKPSSLERIRVEFMVSSSSNQARPTLFLLGNALGAESRLEFQFEAG